jgi:Domain of unknown function (DUF4331)
MKSHSLKLAVAAAAATLTLTGSPLFASSHQDAPLAVLDPAANTTDVYAFVDQDGEKKSLVVALGVYPFEEPGIGPNKFNFDDNVLYEIHVALGADLPKGRATLSYQFEFTSKDQESQYDSAELYRSNPACRRCQPKFRPDVHSYEGGSSLEQENCFRHWNRSPEQSRNRHSVLQRGG